MIIKKIRPAPSRHRHTLVEQSTGAVGLPNLGLDVLVIFWLVLVSERNGVLELLLDLFIPIA